MVNLDKEYKKLMDYKTYFKLKYPTIDYDDIQAELNWSIAKAYDTFDDTKGIKFITLVFHIMHNRCKTILRYQKNRKALIHADSLDRNISDDLDLDLYNYYATTKDTVDYKSILSDLEAFVPTLPKTQSKILSLYLNGYSNKEISEILNTTHNNICMQRDMIFAKFLTKHLNEYPVLREYKIAQKILKRQER